MAESVTSVSKRPRPNAPGPENSGPAPKRPAVRKRAPLACEECRTRKRRCDGALPYCSGCKKRLSTCVYLADIQEKAWQNDMIRSLRSRLKELEEQAQPPDDERREGDSMTIQDEITIPDQPHENQALPDTEVAGERPEPNNAFHNDSHTPTAPPVTASPATVDVNASSATDRSLDPSLAAKKPPSWVRSLSPYSGSTSGASAGRLEPIGVERLMRPIDQVMGVGAKAAASQPHGNAAPATLHTCSCDRLLGVGAATWSLPLRRHADELVELYFHRVHRTYPILHEPTFMRQYRQLWEPSQANAESCSGFCRQKNLFNTYPSTVNAVFALASWFAPGPSAEENKTRASSFFNMTQKFDLLEIIDEEVGIESVQLLLLMGFYLQSTERFSKCWNITGLAIRMAQNISLHLSAHDARKKGLLLCYPSQLEEEMRVRVWYGCVLLDREISMSFGRPLMISGGDQLRLPEAIDDEYLSDEVGGKRNAQPSNCPSQISSYIETIKLYKFLGQVLDREEDRTESSAGTYSDIQALLDFDTRIMEWRDALPGHLQYDPTVENGQQDHVSSPGGLSATDFSGQARRLYTRFLHVRVLILRPALEQFFQKQRHTPPNPQARGSPRVARIQDFMLSDIAAQCVLSADSLVQCLDIHIRSQSLVAWWYNISYLHTCGSTLLMGQLCSFNESVVKRGSLSASWEVCLQCLSGYTGLSSIASKSFHLLQESSRRLLPERTASIAQNPSFPVAANMAQAPNPNAPNASTHAGQPMTPATMAPSTSIETGTYMQYSSLLLAPHRIYACPQQTPPNGNLLSSALDPLLAGAADMMNDGGFDNVPEFWETPFLSQLEFYQPHDLTLPHLE
ncbi:putative transcriptional activator [Triangularia setosa]|uniref:Transcriptional activator n=1 Tax=Triangularia setosa TaxID=2587417 RepID=A0AAN6VZ59_9PEZI|nr:putative transcriptional activator [Podospora setosa]